MQKKDKVIVKNFVYNTLYQVLLILTPLITSPYLSRTLGKEGIGEYQYTIAVAGYFAMVCTLGVGTHGVRECAICKDNREKRSGLFWELTTIRLCVSILSVTAYVIYSVFMGGTMKWLLLIQLGMVLSYALDITWLFYGVEEFGTVVIRNTIIKVLTILLIFLCIDGPEDSAIYCSIMAGSLLLSQLSLWPFSRKYIDWKYRGNLNVWRHIKPLILLFLPMVGVQVYATVDRLMLGQMVGMDAVGLYGSAEGIAKMPYGIITALTVVMLPRLSALSDDGNQKDAEQYRKITMQITMMIAFPICMGLAAISDKLIPWYLAKEFALCSELLEYLVVIILFLAWTDVIQKQCIIPLKKDTILVKSAFLTAVVNVIANMLLIPHYGVKGAVCGTVLSEALVMLYKTGSVWREIRIREYIKAIAPFGLFSVVMYVCVKNVGNIWMGCSMGITLIQILVGGIVYGLQCAVWFLVCHKGRVEQVTLAMKGWKHKRR